MIEKIKSPLDLKVANYKGTEFDIIPADTFVMVCRKINEVIDTVNELHAEAESNARTRADHEHKIEELQARVSILEEHAHPTATTEPTYKNWIGKVCKFWNGENNKTVGVLMEVREIQNKVFFVDDIFCKYEYCEPVKPDDDIIYKGEQ